MKRTYYLPPETDILEIECQVIAASIEESVPSIGENTEMGDLVY